MDTMTENAISKWFKNNNEPMEVDVVTSGVNVPRKFNSLEEILANYDNNGYTVMYFPI